MDTTSGSIGYQVPPSDDARVVMRSTRGAVRSKLSLLAAERVDAHSLHGRLGNGTAPIILNSQTGSITLSAAPDSGPVAQVAEEASGAAGADGESADQEAYSQPSARQRTGRSGPQSTNRGRSPWPADPSDGAQDEQEEDANSGVSPPSPSRRGSSSGPVRRSGGSVIFGGNRRSDEASATQSVGPMSRPREEKRTSSDSAGLSVRIIPSHQTLDGTNHQQQDEPVWEEVDEPQPQPNSGRRSGGYNRPAPGNPQAGRPQYPQSGRQGSRADGDPNIFSPWPTDEDENTDAEAERAPTRRPPTLARSRDADEQPTSDATATGNNESSEETIKLEAALVNLMVSVTDRAGKALPDLKVEDFELAENNQPQKIEFFQSGMSPFNVVLLLDLSGSITDKLGLIKSAAQRFLEMVGPQDKVAVATFTDHFTVISQLTADRDRLRNAIKTIKKTDGGTAFYEAMWLSLVDMLRNTKGQRNAIVVLTDGVDSSLDRYNPAHTRVTFRQLARRLEESDVMVFPIYIDTEYEEVFERQSSTSESYVVARQQLEHMAEVSGGMMFEAKQSRDLSSVYKQVADAIRTVYSIGYYPSNPARDGTYRRVKVKVNRPDAAARTRRGYYAK